MKNLGCRIDKKKVVGIFYWILYHKNFSLFLTSLYLFYEHVSYTELHIFYNDSNNRLYIFLAYKLTVLSNIFSKIGSLENFGE